VLLPALQALTADAISCTKTATSIYTFSFTSDQTPSTAYDKVSINVSGLNFEAITAVSRNEAGDKVDPSLRLSGKFNLTFDGVQKGPFDYNISARNLYRGLIEDGDLSSSAFLISGSGNADNLSYTFMFDGSVAKPVISVENDIDELLQRIGATTTEVVGSDQLKFVNVQASNNN
jgi:hypothetical protein